MRNLLFFLLFLVAVPAASADHFLVGYAPGFVGQQVKLYTYQEYITMKKVLIGQGLVDGADSTFRIQLKNRATVKAVLEIGDSESELYLAPEADYHIFCHKPTGPESFAKKSSKLTFFGLDSTDINYRILQYHQWFDTYVAFYAPEISRGHFRVYLDTFKIYAADAYKDVKDEYFLTYVRYNIAEMDQTLGGNSNSEKRLNTFLDYIGPFPVYHENDQYMTFIKHFYEQDFDDYDPLTEREIFSAIDSASPTMLMKAMKRDIFLANPELREMMMIQRLGKQFYKSNYDKPAILFILDSLEKHAAYPVNANTARNIKLYLTNLERGYPAPVMDLKIGTDSSITWRTFEGKFVYLNFFTTWDTKAMTEMEVMVNLRELYGEDVVFISLCVDKDRQGFEKFQTEHPEMDWDVLYLGEDHPFAKSWKVTAVPAYYLVDQGGYIMAAPAMRPTPDGEYESIDKTFFYIRKVLHPNAPKRIGEP